MSRPPKMRGFTLLELLVVMGLMSAVMLAMGAALRTMAQSEERIDQRLAQLDEMRVSSAFLRTILGRVSARRSVQTQPTATPGPLFAGAPTEVAWVGVMPARFGLGGRHYFHLGLETVDGDSALVLRFAPWSSGAGFPDWQQAQSQVLVQHVTSLQLRYEDGKKVPSEWSAEWAQADSLPARIDLALQTPTGDWPAMVVALRALPDPQLGSGGGGGVIGGAR